MSSSRLYRPFFFFAGMAIISLCSVSCVPASDDGYDPTKPTKVLHKGDYWVSYFDDRQFQNGTVRGSKLYCNTINIQEGQDYLYCFDLQTGKVDWSHPVENFASQHPIIAKEGIYFSTYLGDLHFLDLNGNCLWHRKFGLPDGGFYRDPNTGNFIVLSVVEGVWEYDYRTGQVVDKSRNLRTAKAFLQQERKKIVRFHPYTRNVPSANGMYELRFSPSGPEDMDISKRKL